jgi:tetratricopeptide (TPR) repeat protein
LCENDARRNWCKKNDYDGAVELLGQSAKAPPLDARALYYLGMSHFRMEQPEQSQSALERALEAGFEEPLASDAKRVLATLKKGKS